MNVAVKTPVEQPSPARLDGRRPCSARWASTASMRAPPSTSRWSSGLAALISRHREPDTEVLRFPPVMSRRQLEKSGYLKSFPHLLGCVSCLHGSEAEIRAAVDRVRGRRRLDARPCAGRPRAEPRRLLPGLSAGGEPRPGAGRRPAVRRRLRLLPPRAVAAISTGCSRSACANTSASARRRRSTSSASAG